MHHITQCHTTNKSKIIIYAYIGWVKNEMWSVCVTRYKKGVGMIILEVKNEYEGGSSNDCNEEDVGA